MALLEKEWYIQAPWGRLCIIAWGDCYDPPVLLCHGTNDSAISFRPLLKLLPRKFYYIATKRGSIHVISDMNVEGVLDDVLYCREVPYNLLSVSKIQQAGMTVIFNNEGAHILKDGKIIIRGQQLADALTKPLPAVAFHQHLTKMGLE